MITVLIVNMNQTTTPLVNEMKLHPSSASLVLLPDGRRLAYHEQGVPPHEARYLIIAPHSFLSSRLAGTLESLIKFYCIVLTYGKLAKSFFEK